MLAASGRCRPWRFVRRHVTALAGRAGPLRVCADKRWESWGTSRTREVGNRCRCCTQSAELGASTPVQPVRTSGRSWRGGGVPVPPTTDSSPGCQSVPPPSNSLARCVVALYSPPTQIWWGRVLAEGSRPHRGRCPSRLLPRRALPRRSQWLRVIASRQSTPVRRDRTGAGTHSSGGILTCWHRFGPSLPAGDDPSEFVERPSRRD